jgi:hypothetical protein
LSQEAEQAEAAHRELAAALQASSQERDDALARAAALHERTLELQSALEAVTNERDAGAVAGGELRSTAGWVPQCDIRSLSYFLLPIRQDQV